MLLSILTKNEEIDVIEKTGQIKEIAKFQEISRNENRTVFVFQKIIVSGNSQKSYFKCI